jgi:ABC-type transporter Mla maintaining outer membrane lipid asymmetry ATPase subunit MlaF
MADARDCRVNAGCERIRSVTSKEIGMNSAPQVVARLAKVSKRYGDTLALDGVDLEVHRGELLALLGPNGAGKTTAIAACLGLIEPDTGSAYHLSQLALNAVGEGQDSPLLHAATLIAFTAVFFALARRRLSRE